MFEYLPEITDGPERTEITSIGALLGMFMNILGGIALTVSIITLIYSGIQYSASAGDPKAKATAKAALTYSIVAMVITLSAVTIKVIILNILGSNTTDLIDVTPNF